MDTFKYTIVFSKLGYLRFISHLDMIRLFKRAFKRAEIYLKFSEGFNPHPKMTFAQPLSLGQMSICEILDIETKEFYAKEDIVQKLSAVLPRGIEIRSCIPRDDRYKAMASKILWAKYIVQLPKIDNILTRLEEFLRQDEIKSIKKQKKKKGTKEIDIKPLIREYSLVEVDSKKNLEYIEPNALNIMVKLDCGSISNLNPDLLMTTFLRWLEIKEDKKVLEIEDIDIIRIEMG